MKGRSTSEPYAMRALADSKFPVTAQITEERAARRAGAGVGGKSCCNLAGATRTTRCRR
jgi:hypothetical protein